MPSSILSDRDPLFVSQFWRELFSLQGTTLRMSSSYHPQTDGQTEVVNRCLESYLRCFASEQPKTWSLWVPWAELWYNTTYHVSIGTTPFEVVYGRKPPVITKFVEGEVRVEAVARELKDRDEALTQLKYHLRRAQDQMKLYADKHRRQVIFEVGDWVFLRLRPHRQQSVTPRIHPKLAPRFFGPYQVLKRVGAVSYRLQLPSSSKVHPVFHVSQLKKAIGQYSAETAMPLDFDAEDRAAPEAVLASRVVSVNGKRQKQFLVHWQGMLPDDATWEDEFLLKSQFPNLSLEDKAASTGGGNVRPPNENMESDQLMKEGPIRPIIWRVYSRKKNANLAGS